MPTYQVTDAQTGVKLRLTGDSPPTPAELEQLFAQHAPAATADAAVPEKLQQPAPNAEVGRGARFLRGLYDIPQAGSQMLLHSLPDSVVSKGNELIGEANQLPVIGPLTKAAGIVPESTQQYDQRLAQEEQNYQSSRAAAGQEGIDWPRLGGNITATAPVAMAMPGGGATLSGQTLAAGLQGGALGALQPVYDAQNDFGIQKAQQAGIGAATGAALQPLVRGLSRVISPNTRPEVQALLDEGITPTPGQILGGTAARTEEKLTSLPLIGDAIKSGQRRAMGELNTVAINRALAPIGEHLPAGTTGREAITYAGERLGDAYDDVLTRIGAVSPDQQFTQEITNLSALTQNLPKELGEQFNRIMRNEVLDRIDGNGVMTSEGLKAAESNLGQIARGYMANPDYDRRTLSNAVSEAQRTLRTMLERQSPQYADELRAINRGWANYMRPQRASAALGAEEGVFTPAQLQNAVKALDSTRNKRAFTRGDALMQDLSEAGKTVLGGKYPDSGTPGRLAMGLLGAGGLSAISPISAIIGGASMLPYTPAGQRLAAALLTRRPALAAPMANLLERAAPGISAAGAVATPQLLNQ